MSRRREGWGSREINEDATQEERELETGDSDWRTEVEIKTAEKELGIQQKCNAMQKKAEERLKMKDGEVVDVQRLM